MAQPLDQSTLASFRNDWFRRAGFCMAAFLLLPLLAGSALGGGSSVRSVEGAFEDVLGDLESAVVNKGLVIDYTGNVGDMLARTADAVGKPSPYKQAKYMQFCSAPLTNAVTNASPANLSVCPFIVYAYETVAEPGKVYVGYRKPAAVEGAEKEVAAIEELLAGVVAEVAE
jgi:uncharacterized protein (DUF302 family)